jgi:hypothetical protein
MKNVNSHLKYANAAVQRPLKRNIYPTSAPKPIQYHFASKNSPRDFRTVVPSDSVDPGTI